MTPRTILSYIVVLLALVMLAAPALADSSMTSSSSPVEDRLDGRLSRDVVRSVRRRLEDSLSESHADVRPGA